MNLKLRKRLSTNKLLLLIFLLSISSIKAQDKAKVIDEKSNLPLEAVSISLNNGKVSTITNEKGVFDLKNLLPINENDTLHFTHISYINKSIPLSELKEKDYTVSLIKKDQPLSQVTVTSERLTPNSLIQYKELSPMQDELSSLGAVLVDNKIYVIGGDNTAITDSKSFSVGRTGIVRNSFSQYENYSKKLQVYDILNDKWETSNLKFRKRAYHNVIHNKGKIYVLGGKRYSTNHKLEYLDNTIEIYDIKKDTIIVDNNNPHQAVNAASFVFEDHIFLIGGSIKTYLDKGKIFTHKVHVLDLNTGYWYEMDGMPVDHSKETKGVIIQNVIYLVGGDKGWPLRYINTYDVSTGEYKQEKVLPYGLARPAVAYNNDIIYIFEKSKMQTYNIKTKEFKIYPIDLPLSGSEMFYKDEMLYVLGGSYIDEYSTTPSNHLYTIDISEFDRVKDYKIPSY